LTFLENNDFKFNVRESTTPPWCSPLPVEMQKVEVEFIKTCLSRLPDDLKFYTIHDAICVKESDGERVKEIMEMVSMELYGEKIAVKIENKS